MLEGVKLRVLFAEQEIVVTMSLPGQQKTERLSYSILERSENTLTFEVGTSESSTHVLKLDGDRLVVEHGEKSVQLIRVREGD